MAIEFLCSNPECRKKLQVGDELAGKKVRCPKCKTVCVAPGTDEQMSKAANEQGGVPALDSFLSKRRGQVEPFEAQEEIARGGMGAVILARDKAIQRELAVKVMRPQIADSEEHRLRFLEEAQVTGQLEHPNIVPIHELGKDAEGNLYFTMKLVRGRSLAQILKDMRDAEAGSPTPPHSLSDLLNTFLKICDGMAFAHSKGVIHRDLKPDNIMVGEFGEVQIMDWGLAKVVGQDPRPKTQDPKPGEEGQEEASVERPTSPSTSSGQANAQRSTSESELREADTVPAGGPQSAIRNQESVRSVRSGSDIALTVDGQITGTPAYMPPEQAEGKIYLLDHRSDVYSLGAILYEILTLERPIEGDTVHKVLLNVSEGKITPPEQRTPGRHIPKELTAVVMKAMAKNRRKRYQSVQDLGQDIKLFLEGRSVSAKEDTFVESLVKLVKRNKAVSLATGVATVVLLIGAVVAFAKVTAERNEAVRQKEIAEGERKEAQQAREKQRATALEASLELALQSVRAAEGGRMGEAEIRAEAAEKLASDGPWGHYAWGKIAKEGKDFGAAEERLRKAVATPPENERCKAALAQLLTLMGKLDEAQELAKGDTVTKDWSALRAAGDVLYKAQRYRDAEKMYAAAIGQLEHPQTVPKEDRDWRPILEKADALYAAKLYPDAKASYEKAAAVMGTTKIAPVPVVLATEEKLKRANEAFADLKTDLELALGNARAWVKCEGFYESIRLLPSEQQWKRIEAKLEELNGQKLVMSHQSVDGVLRHVSLSSQEEARCVHPLSGMQLTELNCSGTQVSDLGPLRGMPLRRLDVTGTKVSDLSPLRGMLLVNLCLTKTRVRDLSPLGGMPLEDLRLSTTGVSDLGPLEGMPLRVLSFYNAPVADLIPLKGAPLTNLNCSGTKIEDLSPLAGMPLTTLTCSATQVRDLSPLQGMPLRGLHLGNTKVGDLGPLAGMPLTTLDCRGTQVSDLSPLEGMPLRELSFYDTRASDLTPLKGMPLTYLDCGKTPVDDLSPLKGMPLEVVTFTPGNVTTGIETLRQTRSLKKIGVAANRMWSPDAFWKKYDAGEFR